MTAALTGYTVATLQDLKNIPSTTRVTGYIKAVIATNQWYQFKSDSTEPSDDINIISPTLGTGRWYLMSNYTTPIIRTSDRLYSIDLNYTVYQSSVYSTTDFTGVPGTFSLFTDKSTLTGTSTDTTLTEEYILADLGEPKHVTEHIFGGGRLLDSSNNPVVNIGDILNQCSLYASSDGTNWVLISDISGMSNTQNTFKVFSGTLIPFRYWKLARTSGSDKYVAVSEWTIKGLSTSYDVVNTIEVNVESLIPDSDVIVTVDVPSSFNAIKVQSNYPVRVRAYLSPDLAVADLSRAENTEITPDLGCLLDIVTASDNLIKNIIPSIFCYSSLITPNKLYFSVNNKDSETRTIRIAIDIKTSFNYSLDYTVTNNVLYGILFG